jgi:hypothetical protein
VRLRDLPHDCEPESRAGLSACARGAVEAVEDEREIRLGDSRAVVADGHLAVLHADLDLSARRAPLGRVVEQVRHRPLDRAGRTVDGRLVEVALDRHARPVALCALDRVGGHEIQTDVLGLVGVAIAACELDELGDQRRHLRQLLGHVAQERLAFLRSHRLVPREHFDVRPQARQRRP